MSIAKPFTFVANTYAKASEVNADFDVVYSQVNTNISAIAQNANDIDNLENTKANINGSTSNVFKVADAIADGDAVNKRVLMKSIGNTVDYIGGLTIAKDSGSPEDTIIVSAGSAYDSTHTIVLSLGNSLSKQNLNQAASTTYYVYIIGNSTGSLIDIAIDDSSVEPPLPTGYSLYRQIGYYTTNSNNEIDSINSSALNNIISAGAHVVTQTYVNGKSWYRIWSDGWCEQGGNVVVSTSFNVTFLKQFANTDYNIVATFSNGSPSNYEPIIIDSRSVDKCRVWSAYNRSADWVAQGYIS